jgi:hypothetical protein
MTAIHAVSSVNNPLAASAPEAESFGRNLNIIAVAFLRWGVLPAAESNICRVVLA